MRTTKIVKGYDKFMGDTIFELKNRILQRCKKKGKIFLKIPYFLSLVTNIENNLFGNLFSYGVGKQNLFSSILFESNSI